MKTKTTSEIIDRTVIVSDEQGEQRLLAAHNLIHEAHQSGRMIVDYGQGGISNITFEEKRVLAQSVRAKLSEPVEDNPATTRGIIHPVE